MSVNDMVKGKDWRVFELLKRLRQIVTCPQCGALVATDEGGKQHLDWHGGINAYVGGVDDKFNTIDVYVRGEGGMEDQIRAAIAQLRVDAKAYTDTLRTDTTTAIGADRTRLSAIETEITRTPGGILARLALLEQLGIK